MKEVLLISSHTLNGTSLPLSAYLSKIASVSFKKQISLHRLVMECRIENRNHGG